ncbi:uncharacterized protein G2W53_014646 [Senna tora]|uniref:Uncharacterized protein n=1 Tax=Senna tora TaxID=362788 RepID=A0A834WTM0_9FABA|nr:uncharacterized protein G2W53_014646 [Senna tora]
MEKDRGMVLGGGVFAVWRGERGRRGRGSGWREGTVWRDGCGVAHGFGSLVVEDGRVVVWTAGGVVWLWRRGVWGRRREVREREQRGKRWVPRLTRCQPAKDNPLAAGKSEAK